MRAIQVCTRFEVKAVIDGEIKWLKVHMEQIEKGDVVRFLDFEDQPFVVRGRLEHPVTAESVIHL